MIGISGVIWLIIGYFVYVFKSFSYQPSTISHQLIIIGLMSGVAAILIDAIGSFPFHIAPSAVMSVVLIALTVSMGKIQDASGKMQDIGLAT